MLNLKSRLKVWFFVYLCRNKIIYKMDKKMYLSKKRLEALLYNLPELDIELDDHDYDDDGNRFQFTEDKDRNIFCKNDLLQISFGFKMWHYEKDERTVLEIYGINSVHLDGDEVYIGKEHAYKIQKYLKSIIH